MKKVYVVICGDAITGVFLTERNAKKEFKNVVKRMKELYSNNLDIYYDAYGIFLAHAYVGYQMEIRVVLKEKELKL